MKKVVKKMLAIERDAVNKRASKVREYSKKHNITIPKLFVYIFNRLLHNSNKENENKKVAYTYNPLPENKRAKLEEYITTCFKNKAEFAREAGLDLSALTLIINNRRFGNALTWKKINDVFEKHEIKLPYDLQIKYEVDDKF